MPVLTPEANRAARAILKWSLRDVADQAGIAFSTVHRFESTGGATETTKDKIIAAYAAEGVEIIDQGGTGALLVSRHLLSAAAMEEAASPIDLTEHQAE